MSYRLSPTTLQLFVNCPRCFWLQFRRGIHLPRSIFPSLPGGMDNVIKDYFDRYRSQGELPPEINGKVRGQLVSDQALLKRWRNWRTGLQYIDPVSQATLFGALDDCLVEGDIYIPLDYKTRGYAPKPGESQRYYGLQLNCYAWLLQANGFKAADIGYLVYYYPISVFAGGTVKFEVKPVEILVKAEDGQRVFVQAIECLNNAEPAAHSKCEFCHWA
ncbi:PD-(D/E)XK nuclease family protein, partial [Patescibacteria group bacterium]|nr:PD-(D/E)XK nuclease family protein [Patescibacteria group bacterium]